MTCTFDDFQSLNAILFDVKQRVIDSNYELILASFQNQIAGSDAVAFANQTTADGVGWVPLAPSTVRRKGESRILVKTGALMESLVTVGSPSNVHESTPRGLLFGTNLEYANYLESGTSKMPARPPEVLSEELMSKLCNKIADATIDDMKG